MTTEYMIHALRDYAKKHEKDFVSTCQLNVSAMCYDVADRLEELYNENLAKHGDWILKHIGAGHYWECSVCHTNPCIYVTKDTKYCPNCGAKMDGDVNEH